MFIRIKNNRNSDGTYRQYLQIVKSERVAGKVKQTMLCSLGRLDELQDGSLDNLIRGLAKHSQNLTVINAAEELSSEWSKEYGTTIVFRRLWEKLKLDAIIADSLSKTKYNSDISEAVFAMVLNRLTVPASKLNMFNEWKDNVYRNEFDKLDLHNLYRALDFLADNKDKIESDLFIEQTNLFNRSLDLVFFDTTSTYFEGKQCEGLARYGYSKDHRPDRLQVVIGVMMTRDGRPVAHKVFPGNQSDSKAFVEAIKDLKTRFNVGRVIIVGDRGMMSKAGLEELDKLGFEYILGVKMRKIKDCEAVLDKAMTFEKVKENLEVCSIKYNEKNFIVCHNADEAVRDKAVRETVVESLKERIKTPSGVKNLVGNSAYKKFLSLGETQVKINEKEVAGDAKYDGKYVLQTNTELSASEVATAYKDLWQIERGFRELKSTLELRPVYHWNENRIRGHICVCFLALVLQLTMQKLLQSQNENYATVMSDLAKVKATHIKVQDENYLVRTDLTGKAHSAFKALGLAVPQRVIPIPG